MALIMMIPLATYKNINMKEEEEKRKFSNYQRKEKKNLLQRSKKHSFLQQQRFVILVAILNLYFYKILI